MPTVDLLLKTSSIPSRKVLMKTLIYASKKNSPIKIYGEDYRRSEDKTFFDFISDSERKTKRTTDRYLNWTIQVLEKVTLIAKEEDLKFELDFVHLDGRKWISQLIRESSNNNTLFVDAKSINVTHELMSVLITENKNLFLLTDKSWSTSTLVLGAIDPLHRDDESGTIDRAIIKAGLRLSDTLAQSFKLVYCQYVAEYLTEFRREILQSQKEGVLEFLKKKNLNSVPLTFIKGNPDFALAEAVKIHKGSILILGACRRSSASRYWMGSTVDCLLKAPPCDMLLIAEQ
ncbi:universal stress protein [Vibrio sp. WZ-1]|uniref:universal stress protein n=1 Tax=Vibrio sp. WZ-1 TaxID=3454501 RepID=UPI003F87511F